MLFLTSLVCQSLDSPMDDASLSGPQLQQLWASGLAACLLLHSVVPGAIDLRAVNLAPQFPDTSSAFLTGLRGASVAAGSSSSSTGLLSAEAAAENWELVCSSVRALGIGVVVEHPSLHAPSEEQKVNRKKQDASACMGWAL